MDGNINKPEQIKSEDLPDITGFLVLMEMIISYMILKVMLIKIDIIEIWKL